MSEANIFFTPREILAKGKEKSKGFLFHRGKDFYTHYVR